MGEIQAEGMRQCPEFEGMLRTRIAQYPNVASVFGRQKWLDTQVEATSLTDLHPVAFWILYERYYKEDGRDPLGTFEGMLGLCSHMKGFGKLRRQLRGHGRTFWDHFSELQVACWLIKNGYERIEYEPKVNGKKADFRVEDVPCAIETSARTGSKHPSDLQQYELEHLLKYGLAGLSSRHLLRLEIWGHEPSFEAIYFTCQEADQVLNKCRDWLLIHGGEERPQGEEVAIYEMRPERAPTAIARVFAVSWPKKDETREPIGVLPPVKVWWDNEAGERFVYKAAQKALDEACQLPEDVPGVVCIDFTQDINPEATWSPSFRGVDVSKLPEKIYALMGFSDVLVSPKESTLDKMVLLSEGKRWCLVNPHSKWVGSPEAQSVDKLLHKWYGK